jgi:hypothetical protein
MNLSGIYASLNISFYTAQWPRTTINEHSFRSICDKRLDITRQLAFSAARSESAFFLALKKAWMRIGGRLLEAEQRRIRVLPQFSTMVYLAH